MMNIQEQEQSLRPARLFKDAGQNLVIEWSDRQCRIYSPAELRQNCPCATCATGRNQSDGAQQAPSSAGPWGIAHMNPVGNYAYKIAFTDGHNTGIYPLELLRRLGKERDRGC